MKRIFKNVAVLLALSIAIVSCKDDSNVIEPVNYKVTVNYGEKFESKLSENVTVVLTSTTSGESTTQKTDSKGVANFSVVPDVYNIKATIVLSNDTFKTLFGYDAKQKEVSFSAEENNITINSTSEAAKIVSMLTSRIGDLLFKQIYYVGSNTKTGASFRDIFVEIYNNSNETMYADGLYFAQLYGRNPTSVKDYTLSDGQFDWSKSIGQNQGDKSNTDYSYADHIFQIPGSGTDYPIEPGKSIVIAATAINHKTPLVVGDKKFSVQDPSLVADLSSADFEVNLIEYWTSIGKESKIYATDVDNPSVTNLNVIYNLTNRELILDPLGRDSFVIFRTDDYASYAKLPNPQSTSVTENTKLYVQIPNSVIVDGVETNKTDATKLYPRRLSTAIDGGYVAVDRYSSKSVIRKVVKEVNGRKVLQDTNNSTEDFIILERANPGGWE